MGTCLRFHETQRDSKLELTYLSKYPMELVHTFTVTVPRIHVEYPMVSNLTSHNTSLININKQIKKKPIISIGHDTPLGYNRRYRLSY